MRKVENRRNNFYFHNCILVFVFYLIQIPMKKTFGWTHSIIIIVSILSIHEIFATARPEKIIKPITNLFGFVLYWTSEKKWQVETYTRNQRTEKGNGNHMSFNMYCLIVTWFIHIMWLFSKYIYVSFSNMFISEHSCHHIIFFLLSLSQH